MQLTRRSIIAAAIEIIEREGAGSLSMRRLATDLGCGLMALYQHVPSTAALLDGMAAEVLAGLEASPVAGAWPEQLTAQALAFRRAVRTHPRSSMLLAGRPARAAAMFRPAESALGTLRAAGFSGPDAARIVRAVAAYILGSLLCEVGILPDDGQDAAASRRPHLRTADFPEVTSLTTGRRAASPDADFDFGLNLLLHGIGAPRPGGQYPPPPPGV